MSPDSALLISVAWSNCGDLGVDAGLLELLLDELRLGEFSGSVVVPRITSKEPPSRLHLVGEAFAFFRLCFGKPAFLR